MGTKKIDNLCVDITTGANGEVVGAVINNLHRGIGYSVGDIVSVEKNGIDNFCLLRVTISVICLKKDI